MHARIAGTGRYLPERVVTNYDLEAIMDTSDEWIRQRTGILQRHVVEPGTGASVLGAKAARAAMDKAGVSPDEIEFIICATITPDYHFPATACLIQQMLGIKDAGAMDVGAACSGFIYGLSMADAYIRAGTYGTILLVATEVLSTRLDYTDRNVSVLFGDGAGAVVLKAVPNGTGVLSTYTKADGSASELLYIPAGGTRQVITPENVGQVERTLVMDGRGLYRRAVSAFMDATEQALKQTGVRAEDIDLFIPHQANRRIIASVGERLGIPEEKFFLNLDRCANTSAASIPIALDEAVEKGVLTDGMLVLLAAFGAGLTWASATIRW